eukprot:m.177810 g.177810  ORF g.177810 m.177810 type:complete len:326 (-) comp9976_c0_seq7:857-1834(-)
MPPEQACCSWGRKLFCCPAHQACCLWERKFFCCPVYTTCLFVFSDCLRCRGLPTEERVCYYGRVGHRQWPPDCVVTLLERLAPPADVITPWYGALLAAPLLILWHLFRTVGCYNNVCNDGCCIACCCYESTGSLSNCSCPTDAEPCWCGHPLPNLFTIVNDCLAIDNCCLETARAQEIARTQNLQEELRLAPAQPLAQAMPAPDGNPSDSNTATQSVAPSDSHGARGAARGLEPYAVREYSEHEDAERSEFRVPRYAEHEHAEDLARSYVACSHGAGHSHAEHSRAEHSHAERSHAEHAEHSQAGAAAHPGRPENLHGDPGAVRD